MAVFRGVGSRRQELRCKMAWELKKEEGPQSDGWPSSLPMRIALPIPRLPGLHHVLSCDTKRSKDVTTTGVGWWAASM